MPRKLILDGNTVYELDEECMLQQKVPNMIKRLSPFTLIKKMRKKQ